MNQTCFAFTNGLPQEANGRVRTNNAEDGDIIKYKSDGRWKYSVVTGTTQKCITVFDLEIEVDEGQTRFYRTYRINPITKCYLKDTRRITKIINVNYCI